MAQATTNSYAAEGATNPYLAGSSLSDAIWQPVGALNPNPPPGSIHFLPYEPSDRALYHETTVAGTYSHIAAPSTAPLAPQRHTRIAYDDTIIYPSYTPLLEEEGPAQQRRTEGEPAYQASTPSKEALQDAGSIQVQEHGERLMQRSFGRSLAVDTGREEALAENKGAEEVVIRPRGFPSHSPISSDAPGVSAAIDNSVHELTARMLAPSPPSSESSAESLAPRHARRISLVDLKPFKRAAPAQQRKSTLIITRKSMTAESLGPKGGVVIGGQSRQPSAATATTTSSTSQQPLFKIRRQSVLPETAPGPSPILRPSAVAAVPPGSSAATAAATAAPAAQTHRGKVPPPPPPGAPRNHSTSAPQPQPPKAKPSVTTTATTAAAALPATAAAPATSPAPGNVRPPNAGNALPVMDKPLAEEEVKPKLMSPALSLTLQGTSWRDGGDDKEAEEAEDTAESEDNWIGLPKQLMDSEEGDTSDHNEKEDEYVSIAGCSCDDYPSYGACWASLPHRSPFRTFS